MSQPTFPLVVHADERRVLRTALDVYRDDLGHHEHRVAAIARNVARRIPEDDDVAAIELDAAALKVTWSALHSLLDGTRRDQEQERAHLHALLARLPSEHDVRAIDLDAELARRG